MQLRERSRRDRNCPHDEHRAQRLSEHRSDRNASYPPPERNHKHEVKHNVHHAAEDEEVQRPFRVAHCPEDCPADVVEQQAGYSAKIYFEIHISFRENVSRC